MSSASDKLRDRPVLLYLLAAHLAHLLPDIVIDAEATADNNKEAVDGIELVSLALECSHPHCAAFVDLYNSYLFVELSTLTKSELLTLFADEGVSWLLVDSIVAHREKPLFDDEGNLCSDLAEIVRETLQKVREEFANEMDR